MAFNVRHPVWLAGAPTRGMRTFVSLYFVEAFARASVATVIPLHLFDLFESEQTVSFIYTTVGLTGLLSGLLVPILIRRYSRRWTYTLGGLALIAAAASFGSALVPGALLGLLFRVFGTATLNVTLNLYVMESISRERYVKYDSTRLAVSTVGWAVAPYVGVLLYSRIGPEAAFGLSSFAAVLLIALFWFFRLSEGKAISRGQIVPANPLRNVRRFISQPRLRLAWLLVFGRSSFWATFFVYGPILLVAAGEPVEYGGILVGVANGMLIIAPMWERLNRLLGVRQLAGLCFVGMSVMLFGAGMAGVGWHWVAGGCLLGTAFIAVGLDTIGQVPFYRAVHPLERVEMTAVYRSYLDFSELLPPLFYGVLLGFFGLGVVFTALGVWLLICGGLCFRYLHPRLR